MNSYGSHVDCQYQAFSLAPKCPIMTTGIPDDNKAIEDGIAISSSTDGGGKCHGGFTSLPAATAGDAPPIKCSLLCSRWVQRSKATFLLLLGRPSILFVSFLVFATLCGAGLAGVLTAARYEVNKARDLAQYGIGSQVAQSLREALKTSTLGSELLGAVVVQMPNCSSIDNAWGSITSDIMSRVDPAVVQQLELDVAGVIWKAFPPFEPSLAFLYGRDMLREPDDRPGMIYTLSERRTLILGPYTCKKGFKCAFTVTPIFLPAPDESYDWGCGYQPYNCTDLCWNPVNKTKFWGQVSTMLNLDPFFSGTDYRLVMLHRRGYNYKLWQAHTSPSNPFFILANNTADVKDPVVSEILIENLLWYLELAPAAGWVPSWRAPCLAVVVVGSFLVSLLVLWLLVSKEQHNTLLRAMLPPKVIKQLQDGAHAIAEHFDSVTVLFSDIVGYTAVASQLTPFQVVTLLNELFTVFDELTQRNGVYKVETIGDALMCVAGCPVAEDAARNAQRIARMALDMIQAVEQFRPSLEGVRVQIRVGIHSGPVVAGVIGKKMPRYCLFGDTVNTSSRMESTSQPMRIQVSSVTAALLRTLPGDEFFLEPRGPVTVKGKGCMETFYLRASNSLAVRTDSVSVIVSRPIRSVTLLPANPTAPSPLSSRLNRVRMELAAQAVAGGCVGGSGCGGGGVATPRVQSASGRLSIHDSAAVNGFESAAAAAAPPPPPQAVGRATGTRLFDGRTLQDSGEHSSQRSGAGGGVVEGGSSSGAPAGASGLLARFLAASGLGLDRVRGQTESVDSAHA